MKMTILIQDIKGDIRSHMLITYNLPTADFDDSCTKVEDYYRNVYTDNSGGQVAALNNPKKKKPWPPYKKRKWQNWQYGYGKGKYDYDKVMATGKTKVMEENRKDRHYHPTIGKARTEEKEKETRI
eukprot:3854308-Amphidinium_carterae.1